MGSWNSSKEGWKAGASGISCIQASFTSPTSLRFTDCMTVCHGYSGVLCSKLSDSSVENHTAEEPRKTDCRRRTLHETLLGF